MDPRPPDDALARLARWDELRRRAAGSRAPRPMVEDVTQTLQDLAARHPSLSVEVATEDGGVVWRVRVTDSTAARLADLLREHPPEL